MKIIKGTSLILLSLYLAACTQINSNLQQSPEAIEGVIDLRDWDFEKDGSVNLAGEWAFFWGELLQPDQISNLNQALNVSVPDIWTNYDVEEIVFTPEGYATYDLRVYLPDLRQTYGIYIEGQGSAYKLWVDGRLLAQNGQVGTNQQAMTPEKKPITVFFEPDREMVEIVLQISNFHHRKGGFRNTLSLGLAETVHQYQMQNWFVEAFSVGVLFVMGLYYLFIYSFRTKDKAPLYFALISWMMTLRIGLTNQNTLLIHFPILSWSLALRIEYLTFFLASPLFSLFLKKMYPKDMHSWFIKVAFGLGISFSLYMLFVDTLRLSYTPPYYQIIIFLELIYYFSFLGRIIVNRREGAIPIALASLIWVAAIVIETLSLRNFLPYGQITSFSFLAFIFVQAVLLSARFSKSFQQVENLSVELEETNISLQESEKKYRNIFEDSKDIIFISGLDSQIKDVSPACEEVLGYTKIELQQMTILEVMVQPALRHKFENAISERGSVKNFEVELQRKDGQKIDALVSATLRQNESGKVTGIQGSVRDITDRKRAATERLRALKLEKIAITDPLTKIYNRRFFYEAAEKEIERAKRSGSPLSVIMFDIDHFKNVNDTYGHLMGDQVLIDLVDVCQKNIRRVDIFARFGGEEFIVLLPDTSEDAALKTAEKLRQLVAEQVTQFGKKDVSVTISLGMVSERSIIDMDVPALLDKADQALYQSKENGRNQVTVWRKGK